MKKELKRYFGSKIQIPLIRHGERQRLETLIHEETLLLAKYLRARLLSPKEVAVENM